MRLIPITVIHSNDHRQIVHVNLEQVVSVFKEGDNHYLAMAVMPTKRITKEDYNLILEWSNE